MMHGQKKIKTYVVDFVYRYEG